MTVARLAKFTHSGNVVSRAESSLKASQHISRSPGCSSLVDSCFPSSNTCAVRSSDINLRIHEEAKGKNSLCEEDRRSSLRKAARCKSSQADRGQDFRHVGYFPEPYFQPRHDLR